VITAFVERWDARKGEVEAIFAAKHPGSYRDVVAAVVGILTTGEYGDDPDPERIHVIDDGDCQGTLLFVIGAKGYQPSDYWYVKVSCSGRDTLQSIRGYGDDDKPDAGQVAQYMTLAFRVVRWLKAVGGNDA
jgi:hypothetical protein